MAIPTVTTQQISEGIVKALENLPAIEKDQMFIQPLVDPFNPLPTRAPIAPPQEARTTMPAITPPISTDVIITPPSMAAKPSLLLPILVAGAILLIQ